MAVSQPKHNLPNLLHKISLKLNSLFLQKLVLLEQQQPEYQNVRHYDLECEGVQVLVGFFKNKQQNLLCKAFTNIREGRTLSNEKVTVANIKTNGTTRRTFHNTTFTVSQHSLNKEMFCPTIRSQRSSKPETLTAKSHLNKTSTNLQHLLSRVKLANSRQDGIYSFRQTFHSNNNDQIRENLSHYIGIECTSPKTELKVHRTNPSNQDQNDFNYHSIYSNHNIRQVIIDKFDQIENRLDELNVRRQPKKPQLSKQIRNEIDTIKQRFKIRL